MREEVKDFRRLIELVEYACDNRGSPEDAARRPRVEQHIESLLDIVDVCKAGENDPDADDLKIIRDRISETLNYSLAYYPDLYKKEDMLERVWEAISSTEDFSQIIRVGLEKASSDEGGMQVSLAKRAIDAGANLLDSDYEYLSDSFKVEGSFSKHFPAKQLMRLLDNHMAYVLRVRADRFSRNDRWDLFCGVLRNALAEGLYEDVIEHIESNRDFYSSVQSGNDVFGSVVPGMDCYAFTDSLLSSKFNPGLMSFLSESDEHKDLYHRVVKALVLSQNIFPFHSGVDVDFSCLMPSKFLSEDLCLLLTVEAIVTGKMSKASYEGIADFWKRSGFSGELIEYVSKDDEVVERINAYKVLSDELGDDYTLFRPSPIDSLVYKFVQGDLELFEDLFVTGERISASDRALTNLMVHSIHTLRQDYAGITNRIEESKRTMGLHYFFDRYCSRLNMDEVCAAIQSRITAEINGLGSVSNGLRDIVSHMMDLDNGREGLSSISLRDFNRLRLGQSDAARRVKWKNPEIKRNMLSNDFGM